MASICGENDDRELMRRQNASGNTKQATMMVAEGTIIVDDRKLGRRHNASGNTRQATAMVAECTKKTLCQSEVVKMGCVTYGVGANMGETYVK